MRLFPCVLACVCVCACLFFLLFFFFWVGTKDNETSYISFLVCLPMKGSRATLGFQLAMQASHGEPLSGIPAQLLLALIGGVLFERVSWVKWLFYFHVVCFFVWWCFIFFWGGSVHFQWAARNNSLPVHTKGCQGKLSVRGEHPF